MNKQMLIVGAVVVVLLLGGILVMSQKNSSSKAPLSLESEVPDNAGNADDLNSMKDIQVETTASSLAGSPTAMGTETEVKAFTVEATNFKFSPTELKVKQGDKVKVTFVNKDGLHDWVLEGYNVRTAQIDMGKSETVEFVAAKVGTFEYYCSVGQHRKMGMVGKLVVE